MHALLRGDVVDAVVDHQPRLKGGQEDLRLGHIGPQERTFHVQPPDRAADQEGQQAGVQAPSRRVVVKGQDQRREHVHSAGLARRPQAQADPAENPAEVAAGELRPAQAQRLDEQDAVAACEAPHELVLVRRERRVPVREADANEVESLEPHSGTGSPGRKRERSRSNSSMAVS